MKKRLLSVFCMLLCMASQIWACWSPAEYEGGTSFRIIQPFPDYNVEYNSSNLDETVNFWYGYLKKNVKQEVIREFFENAPYNALDNPDFASSAFVQAVKKDAGASKYLRACLMLQGSTDERWEYRTDGDCLAEASKMVKQMGSLPDAFQYRLVLLKMRIATAQKNYKDVEKLWQEKGQLCTDKALQNRMKGYYAGVLYQEEKYADAMKIYLELGDQMSVRWCISNFVGYEGIKTLVENRTSDNDPCVLYALQDFVNYHSARYYDDFAMDEETREKVVSDVKADGSRMKQFCQQMANKGGADKIAWLSALAWMELSDGGSNAEALRYAQEACKQKGTALQKDNAERILMWARLRTAPVVVNDKTLKALANDLQMLYSRAEAEFAPLNPSRENNSGYRYSYVAFCPNYCFLMDTYKPALDEYLSKNHISHGKVMADNMCDQILALSYEGDVSAWGQTWFRSIDTDMTLEDAASFCEAVKTRKYGDAFAQQLNKKFSADAQLLNDLVGTKCMREGKYGMALSYFKQLTGNYIHSTNYRAYLFTRNFGYNVMFQRSQREMVDESMTLPEAINFKAQFCEDMVNRINALNSLSGDEKAKAEIEMAHRMFQASNMGDLWAMSEFGWTCEQQPNKMCAQARVQLNNALKDCQSEAVRFDAYYGLALVPTGEAFWTYEYDWETSTSSYKFTRFHPSRAAYDYLLAHRNVRDLVSTCDVLQNYAMQNK